jgi:hypothetical protein
MGTQVLEWSLRALLMAAATAAVLRAFRVRAAAARHLAWTGVLAAMLLLPVWTAWGPKFAAPVLPAAVEQATPPASFELLQSRDRQGAVEQSVVTPPASSPNTRPVPPAPAPAAPQPWNWRWVALACYFAVFGAMALRLLTGSHRALALARSATPGPGFLSSTGCAAPVTVGWLKPVILLPENWPTWPAAELDAVLTHEREHVRRRDPLVQWLALLNRAVFWFHPLAWWLERKLSALAEDACDAAVLQRGHDPHAYSDYLIDLARSVAARGGRVAVLGTAIDGGALASRIRRILDGRPAPAVPRRRLALALGLCALALTTFAACKLERAQKPAPGQLSMNELEKRRAAERKQSADEQQALLDEAKNMTPEQAQAKVAALKANPQDERTHYQLMRYYEFHSDLKGKNALILWYIEHEPGGKVLLWNINPAWDRAGYDRGKSLWLANLKKPGAGADIHSRAAAFLEGADKPLAEGILLAGRKAYPDDKRWAGALGRHYAQALLGAAEPLTEYNVFRSVSASQARGPYAESVRAKLAKSNDARLLAYTADGLLRGCSSYLFDPQPGIDPVAMAASYASRAVALDPASELAQSTNFLVQQFQDGRRLAELRKLSPEEQARLGAADRMQLVRFETSQAWGVNGNNSNLDVTAAKARELLDLAARNPNEPQSAGAVFEANIVLGKVALRKGDKREAARYLLAAADAPASESLRLGPVFMNLPRALIDWGERDAVAQFLDRMAPKIPNRAKEFQNWAAQIRKGINPEMIPNMGGCGQEPC